MKIAILGTRGIPARYGGFEKFAEELSTRLVKKGHEVFVYCRSYDMRLRKDCYKGVELITLPTIRHKYLDTVVHTFLSVLHVLFTPSKIVYFCNPINAVFTIIPRFFRKKTILNVDGLEWQRKKWNFLGRLAHRTSEYIATFFPNEIVTDSKTIHDYYYKKYGKDSTYITYGADITDRIPPAETLKRFNLKERGYILYVSRLEPENNAHLLIKAYEKVKTDIPLLIVGDAPYNPRYVTQLKATTDKRIIFAGSIYGEGYFELLSNAFLYVHGNEVGGTNPALLQAMASRNCVLVNGVEFNREVIGDSGVCFKPGDMEDLRGKIEYLIHNPEETEKYRNMAVERTKKCYDWNEMTDRTEKLMKRLIFAKTKAK